jgi:hypothetical protein
MFVPGLPGVAGKAIGITSKTLAPFVVKAALGAACALGLILGSEGLGGLFDFLIDSFQVIKKALELGGHILARLADYAVQALDAGSGWVKAAYVIFSVLTVMWVARELMLWILNLLWGITASMSPEARRHHNRVEDILTNVSIPLWDTMMWKWGGTLRGRYYRQKKGANPE